MESNKLNDSGLIIVFKSELSLCEENVYFCLFFLNLNLVYLITSCVLSRHLKTSDILVLTNKILS